MEHAIVTFVNPDSENTKIEIKFNFDREKNELAFENTFEKESDEKLDFIGFLAMCLLQSLQTQGK